MKFTTAQSVSNKASYILTNMNMQIKDLALATGIPATTITRIKTIRRGISFKKIQILAEALNIYPSDFLPNDWINPAAYRSAADSGMGAEQVKSTVSSVFKAAKEMSDKIGEEFATIDQLAEIVAILLEEESYDPDTPESARKILRGIAISSMRQK